MLYIYIMELKNKNKILKNLLFFILMLKILWIIVTSIQYYTQTYYNIHTYDSNILYIEKLIHSIYDIAIGVLLVYLFHHLTTKTVCIDGTIKKYLYSFGILMILGNIQQVLHVKWFYPFIR